MWNSEEDVEQVREGMSSGLKIGLVIAVAISWSVNKSILWATLHGIFGWGYVLYFHFFVR